MIYNFSNYSFILVEVVTQMSTELSILLEASDGLPGDHLKVTCDKI